MAPKTNVNMVVATATPHIIMDLRGEPLFSWVFAVYTLTTCVATPIFGKLADLFGRKAVFAAASAYSCSVPYYAGPHSRWQSSFGSGPCKDSVPERSRPCSLRSSAICSRASKNDGRLLVRLVRGRPARPACRRLFRRSGVMAKRSASRCLAPFTYL